MYIIGGSSIASTTEIYCYDTGRREWRNLNGANHPRVSAIHLATTLAGDFILVLCPSTSNRLWKFDLVLEEWTLCTCNSDSILANSSMLLEYIEHRQECIQFGGYKFTGSTSDDLNALRLEDMSWYKPVVKGQKPEGVSNMASCVVGTTIYMFGGKGAASDGLRLLHCDGRSEVMWSIPDIFGPRPSHRYNSTITNLFHCKLLVVGGYFGDFRRDMWMYSVKESRWTELESNGMVEGRVPSISQHGAAYIGNKLIITGSNDRQLIDSYVTLEGLH